MLFIIQLTECSITSQHYILYYNQTFLGVAVYNPYMIASQKTIRMATTHLSSHDPILAKVILKYGQCTIKPHNNYYRELVSSIISQQLSVKAAATIEDRFIQLFGDKNAFPSPAEIMKKSTEEIRSAGISNAKAGYIRDLALNIIDGRLKLYHLDNLSNEDIIKELTVVNGIGEWTVHMFLIFSIGRLDVLATGDLGIKNGIKKLYNLDHTPSTEEMQQLAETNGWHPYQSVACWYIWQPLDNK